MNDRLTYSAIAAHKRCPAYYQKRYEQGFVKRYEDAAPLRIGSLWHDVREILYRGYAYAASLLQESHGELDRETIERVKAHALGMADRFIRVAYGHTTVGTPEHHEKHLLRGMARAYSRQWREGDGSADFQDPEKHDDGFDIVAIEQKLGELPLRNPNSTGTSRTFKRSGMIDGVRRRRSDGAIFLDECKTAARITPNYVDGLFLKLQIRIYARAYQEKTGVTPVGVFYDVLPKCPLQQKAPETPDDFRQRLAEMAKRHEEEVEALKTEKGRIKGRAKRAEKLAEEANAGPRAGELNEVFEGRVNEWYRENPPERFVLPLTEEDLATSDHEAWFCGEQIKAEREAGFFPQNEMSCHVYNRPCPYTESCRNGINPGDPLFDEVFEMKAPHSELGEKTLPPIKAISDKRIKRVIDPESKSVRVVEVASIHEADDPDAVDAAHADPGHDFF